MKLWVVFSIMLLAAAGFAEKPSVVLVSNSIDYPMSGVPGFLNGKGLEVTKIGAADFEAYKNTNFVVILGGPDAPDGIGELVTFALTTDEEGSLRAGGNAKMYVKTNVWRTPQVVMIIAGSDRQATKRAGDDNGNGVVERVRAEHFNVAIIGAETGTGKDMVWDMYDIERLTAFTRPLYGKSWKQNWDAAIGQDNVEGKLISDTGEVMLEVFDASAYDSNLTYHVTFRKPATVPKTFCNGNVTLWVRMKYQGEMDEAELGGIKLENC
ncbi:MAG: hypothetical protein ABH829_02695 [archaeon]